MRIELISYTQPAEYFAENMTELVAFCARVSNPSNQNNKETSEKLIRYLIKNSHFSPLEMVNMCLEVTTTRDIARQILRHRSFTFQEFCITGDSLITCGFYNKNGKFTPYYVPIEKLFVRQKWKNYKDILVRVYDEKTKFFNSSKIKEVFKTGVKPVYKVKLSDGKEITCTKEHKFLSESGWDTLEKISGMTLTKNGKVILEKPQKIAVNGQLCYQNKEWLSQKKIESIQNKQGLSYISDCAGVGYSTIRKWLSKNGLSYTKKEVALYTDVWNKNKTGYKVKPRTKEQKEYMRSITPKGENHPLYKGGSGALRKRICNFLDYHRKDIYEKYDYICQHCKKKLSGKIHLHHIKEVAEYPELAFDLDNVIPMHDFCHREHHGKNTHFNKLTREKHLGNTLVPKFVDIETIEYVGEQETYDMEIEHESHNYVANKICVHNSQRYADPTKDLDFVTREARLQDTKNRQNSIKLDMNNDEHRIIAYQWEMLQNKLIEQAKNTYEWAISKGIAKEQARAVLPEGNTVSRLYVNGTLRSWLHYIQLRSGNGTQLEHIEVAKACAEVIAKVFPMAKEFVEQ
jgi:thymidylate synthase (FAD)